jgi:hypothetical protein
MVRRLFFLALVVFPCRSLMLIQPNEHETSSEVTDTLFYTFNNPKCSNPCWLGIELGITDKETAVATLQEYDIKYTFEGYGGDSIWLHDIPGGLFPDVAPGEFTQGWIGVNPDGPVYSMTFDVDFCVSTLVRVYGEPDVWDGILVYPDYQLFFSMDWTTRRVDGVYLHLEEAIPSIDQLQGWSEFLQDWPEYADTFSGECSDVFTGHEGAE